MYTMKRPLNIDSVHRFARDRSLFTCIDGMGAYVSSTTLVDLPTKHAMKAELIPHK